MPVEYADYHEEDGEVEEDGKVEEGGEVEEDGKVVEVEPIFCFVFLTRDC